MKGIILQIDHSIEPLMNRSFRNNQRTSNNEQNF